MDIIQRCAIIYSPTSVFPKGDIKDVKYNTLIYFILDCLNYPISHFDLQTLHDVYTACMPFISNSERVILKTYLHIIPVDDGYESA